MSVEQIKQQMLAAADELDRKDQQIDGLLKMVEEQEKVIAETCTRYETVLSERDAYYEKLIADLIRRAEDAEKAVDVFLNQMPSMLALRAEEN